MKKILLASHGEMAFGLKQTLEFFLGEDSCIQAIGAYLDEGANYLNEVENIIKQSKDEELVIFTDIYGGSVNQQISALLIQMNRNIPLITSMNLPIILSIALSEDAITAKKVEMFAQECMPKMVQFYADEEGGEESFFE